VADVLLRINERFLKVEVIYILHADHFSIFLKIPRLRA